MPSFNSKTGQSVKSDTKARIGRSGNHPPVVDRRLEHENSLRRFEEWKRQSILEQQMAGKKR